MHMLDHHCLFPTVVSTSGLHIEPVQQASLIRALLALRDESFDHSNDGCAWTGDINGVWQLHQHPAFKSLAQQVMDRAWLYLDSLGFERSQVALHLQRCWPVISDWDQAVGRHHHPNAHLSAVLYLTGNGSGEEGVLRLHASHQPNELVAGLAVGYGGPIAEGHPFNQAHWDLAPRPGLLVLFPSSLHHSVLPNDAPDELRCSISFDFVLTAPVQGGSPEYLAPHPRHWDSLEEPIA